MCNYIEKIEDDQTERVYDVDCVSASTRTATRPSHRHHTIHEREQMRLQTQPDRLDDVWLVSFSFKLH